MSEIYSSFLMAIGVYTVIGIIWSIILFKVNGGADFFVEVGVILFFGFIWPITIPIGIFIFVSEVIEDIKNHVPNE